MSESRGEEREGRQLYCRVITPERMIFDDQVDLVITQIADGQIGVLVDHAPTVSTVEIGDVRIQQGEERHVYATSDGFFKVSENLVQILVEEAVPAGEINTDEAQNRIEEAEQELSGLSEGGDEENTERARADIERRRRMGENMARVAREYGGE